MKCLSNDRVQPWEHNRSRGSQTSRGRLKLEKKPYGLIKSSPDNIGVHTSQTLLSLRIPSAFYSSAFPYFTVHSLHSIHFRYCCATAHLRSKNAFIRDVCGIHASRCHISRRQKPYFLLRNSDILLNHTSKESAALSPGFTDRWIATACYKHRHISLRQPVQSLHV